MRDQTLWTWHLLAGALILVLLGMHMAIMHLDEILKWFNPAGGHPTDWANVAARAKSIGFAVSYVLLLLAALYHGFYGLRNILLELNPSAVVRRVINVVLVVGGLGLFAFGSWAAVATFQNAQTQPQASSALRSLEHAQSR
jgi:succinate dehydrogenase hydrophobic anchor subunit